MSDKSDNATLKVLPELEEELLKASDAFDGAIVAFDNEGNIVAWVEHGQAILTKKMSKLKHQKAIMETSQKLSKLSKESSASATEEHTANAIAYVNSHIGEKLSLKVVSDAIYVSSFYLSHLFKKELGVSFTSYLKTVQMTKSAEMLTTTKLSIAEIAEAVGYTDSNYFFKTFKKYHGLSPLMYRTLNN